MTQEEKQLLLIDLCARLPYGVNILVDLEREFDGGTYGVLCRIEPYVGEKHPELKGQFLLYQQGCLTPLVVEEVRPYLRPISSITDDEKKDLENTVFIDYPDGKIDKDGDYELSSEFDMSYVYVNICQSYIDWLNAHYFDFRKLIERGLALEAPADMYKTE